MKVHEDAVKQIVRYLVGTVDKGLVFWPQNEIVLEAFVDADFAGFVECRRPRRSNLLR